MLEILKSKKRKKIEKTIGRLMEQALEQKIPKEEAEYLSKMGHELKKKDKEKLRVADTLIFRTTMNEAVNHIKNKLGDHESKLDDLHERIQDLELLQKGKKGK